MADHVQLSIQLPLEELGRFSRLVEQLQQMMAAAEARSGSAERETADTPAFDPVRFQELMRRELSLREQASPGDAAIQPSPGAPKETVSASPVPTSPVSASPAPADLSDAEEPPAALAEISPLPTQSAARADALSVLPEAPQARQDLLPERHAPAADVPAAESEPAPRPLLPAAEKEAEGPAAPPVRKGEMAPLADPPAAEGEIFPLADPPAAVGEVSPLADPPAAVGEVSPLADPPAAKGEVFPLADPPAAEGEVSPLADPPTAGGGKSALPEIPAPQIREILQGPDIPTAEPEEIEFSPELSARSQINTEEGELPPPPGSEAREAVFQELTAPVAGYYPEVQLPEAPGGAWSGVREELTYSGPAPLTAEAVSLAFQRDDRRYDNGFPLY